MSLKLFDALLMTDALCWSSLQALVDEVRGFLVPAVRNRKLLDRHLADEDLITDIFSCSSLVRSLTHHALVSDNADGEVVSSHAVVLAAHDLGRHVARRSARLTRVISRENTGDAEVREAQVAFIVENQVLGLDIPMDDQLCVDGIKGVNEARDEEAGNLLVELASTGDMIAKVTSQQQVHDEEEVHLVLERVMHIDNERALDHR